MADLQRLRDLFDALLEVPAEAWEDWFEQRGLDTATRAELLQLAQSDESSGLLDLALDELVGQPAPDPTGRRVGPFRLLRRLGEGGMANVHLAVREGTDFEQTVALKLLRHSGLSEIERDYFRRERQLLARLSHPNIARLIDGGVTDDGVPYLAMEYVRGTRITHWCRERGLDLDARVVLVAKVARAVAAAHAALIVHRDIKPANVLVDDEGEPRLLDFGIAKLLEGDEHTRPGFAPMTPEYAAPEQFDGGPITTATDVYSLGVLLYELLTGERPQRNRLRAPSAALQAQRSATGRNSTGLRIARDLDRIALMALAEDPARRYSGAATLADDLERWLERQPVLAHPPSAWYHTRKFVERHRGGAALVALLMLGIFASLALALQQAHVAQQEAARARRVQDFLIAAVEAARTLQPRERQPTVHDVVTAAAVQVESDTALDADTRAELLLVLGKVATGAADYDAAQALLARARAAAEQLPAAHRLQWPVRVWEARLRVAQDDPVRALSVLEETVRLPPPADVAEALDADMVRARALYLSGKPDEAAKVAEAVVAAADRRLADDPQKSLEYRFALGELLAVAGHHQRTIEVLDAALERHRALGLEARLPYLDALAGLAQAEVRVGNVERAHAAAEEAVTLSRRIFEPPHPHIARALSALGLTLNARGDTAGSAEVFREALAMRRELQGADDPALIPAQLNVGAIEALLGRHEAALAHFAEALRICTLAPQSTRSLCGMVRHRVAGTYVKLDRLPEAEREADLALELRREVHGAQSGEAAASLALLANIARKQGRFDAALARSKQAQATLASNPDASRNVRAEVGIVRVRALLAAGQAEAALQLADQQLEWWQRDSPDEKQFLVQMLADRSQALLVLGRTQEARAAAEQAFAQGLGEAEIGAETLQRLRQARPEP